jgi:YD repeat-containing protein
MLSVIDASGHIIFTRASARLLSVADPTGQSTHFAFDGYGRLLVVSGPAGPLATFSYTSAGRIASITRPGGATSYVYDEIGRLITAVDSALGGITITHAPAGVSAVSDAGGATFVSYDGRGDLVQVSGGGQIVGYAYDSLGQLTSVSQSGGLSSYAYLAGQLVRVGNVGGATSYSYDAGGRLVRIVHPNGAITAYSYDSGRLASEVAPDGSVTTYSYDAAGRLVRTTAASNVTAFTYNDAGNLSAIADQTRGTTSFTYGLGSLSLRCPRADPQDLAALRPPMPSPGTSDCLVQIPGGVLQVHSGGWFAEGPLAGGGVYRLDDSGHVTEITDASGNSVPISGLLIRATDFAGRTTNFVYDSLGHLIAVTGPSGTVATYAYSSGSGGGKVNTTSNDSGAITRYTYDANGHLVRVVDPAGITTTLTYLDGRLITQNEIGAATSFIYGSAGDLLRASSPLQTVIYTYETPGRLSSIIDPAGNTTTYTYDNGRLVSVTGLPGVTSYTYDSAGELIRSTNPFGATTSFSYTDGLLGLELTPDGNSVAYTYSSAGRLIMISTSSNGATRYTYDSRNDIVSIEDRVSRTTSLMYGGILYSTTGFLPPIASGSTAAFKAGTTVPVKFQLTGASATIVDLQVGFYFARIGEPESSGGFFRFDTETAQYVAQWATKGLSKGPYILRADLGNGQAITAQVTLR